MHAPERTRNEERIQILVRGLEDREITREFFERLSSETRRPMEEAPAAESGEERMNQSMGRRTATERNVTSEGRPLTKRLIAGRE